MSAFEYKNEQLYCEEIPLEKLAQDYKTPLYVYSYNALKTQFQRFDEAFNGVDHLICFSMKANSNKAVLKTFINLGSGIDVVSGGELKRALDAGCPAGKIVFSGVGKTDEEITQAIHAGILQFNVESREELTAINEVAKGLQKKAPIALRVNPDVDPKTHPYISTGFKKAKFGIAHNEAVEIYQSALAMEGIEIVGIDCHIGSQLTTVEPFVEALNRVKDLLATLKSEGIEIRNLDLGGGLGIVYENETPPTPEVYAQAIKDHLKGIDCRLILEPGRFLTGNSGVLLTQVIFNKVGQAKNFIIVDAASNDLMRPSLYGAYHLIQPLKRVPHKEIVADIVGPICESGDFFAQDRKIQSVGRGEYLAIMSTGAYGHSMASTYNSRPRPTEVLVNGKAAHVIRERDELEDIYKREKVPAFLES